MTEERLIGSFRRMMRRLYGHPAATYRRARLLCAAALRYHAACGGGCRCRLTGEDESLADGYDRSAERPPAPGDDPHERALRAWHDSHMLIDWRLLSCEGGRQFSRTLVPEIVGDPFRPVAFDPVWRTSDVAALATGIYDERTFDQLPILADALQDAGCDSDDLLNHLRDPHAAHVRGCWALDLVLGKE